MKSRFIMFNRAGVFYSEDTTTGKQHSLRTKDEAEALALLHSKNEAHRQPVLNLHVARAYHAPDELSQLQREGIRTVISDPVKNRNLTKLSPDEVKAVLAARRSAGSESGKQLLKKRGMHLERSFAHVLDAGGARRTTLRGLENLNKRHKVSAAIYNLSQLMRAIWGVGTPKQWVAGVKPLVWILFRLFVTGWLRLVIGIEHGIAGFRCQWEQSWMQLAGWAKYMVDDFSRPQVFNPRKSIRSTGC